MTLEQDARDMRLLRKLSSLCLAGDVDALQTMNVACATAKKNDAGQGHIDDLIVAIREIANDRYDDPPMPQVGEDWFFTDPEGRRQRGYIVEMEWESHGPLFFGMDIRGNDGNWRRVVYSEDQITFMERLK